MNRIVSIFVSAVLAAGSLASATAADSGKQKGGKAQQNPLESAPQVDLTQPLTLERAIQIALANQSTLGIARTQLESSRARLTQARASFFPSVSPSYQYSNQLTTQSFNGQSQTGRFEQGVAQISANQLIFDTGKREEGVAASKYAVEASRFNVLDTRQTIIVGVSTAYYELQRRKELVRVAQASVDRAKTTLDATRAFAEAGTGPQKDILQAEADYGNAQVQLIVAQNDVRLAVTALKNQMGILTQAAVTTPDTPLPAPPAQPDAKTSADYLRQALDLRPDLMSEAANINANRHDVRIAEINSGLTVQSSISEGYRVDPNPGENRQFVTSFAYPLFDAGLTRAQVRQARAALEQARLQRELTKQAIQQQVEQAYLVREEARARVQAADTALRAARLNYEAATAARREGAGNILDVITAQTALVTAETNAVQAIYDFYTSNAQLMRAVGQNDPYLAGVKNP